MMKVGVLAVQGAVGLHLKALGALGVTPVEVRTHASLNEVDALVLPGGESTTISRLIVTGGLAEALTGRISDGLPVLGTCAGMILLATEVLDGRPDQRSFAAVDIDVRRNAFGRQVDSFEVPLSITGIEGDPFHGVFIRAPFVERVGEDVEVLASVDGHPVACRQGAALVTAFHPELASTSDGRPDLRVHLAFLAHASRVS